MRRRSLFSASPLVAAVRTVPEGKVVAAGTVVAVGTVVVVSKVVAVDTIVVVSTSVSAVDRSIMFIVSLVDCATISITVAVFAGTAID
jgi:hypothetical protein